MLQAFGGKWFCVKQQARKLVLRVVKQASQLAIKIQLVIQYGIS